MSTRLLALLVVLVAFGVLSAVALSDVGYVGIVEPLFRSWGAAQVGVDLVIFALLACIWMVTDARHRGATAWPFVLLTLVGGSFGPLLYLTMREITQGHR